VDLLYDKRHLWFTQELDRTDIENSFTSPIRAYKTGNFLVRVNLEPNRNFTHIQPFSCKVFDEHKKAVPVEYIKDEHTVISIIEFQGIKFTSRNFQMELLLRQVLVIPDVPLFETCIISEPSSTTAPIAQVKQKVEEQPRRSDLGNNDERLIDHIPDPIADLDHDDIPKPVDNTTNNDPESLTSKYLGCNPESEIKHFGVTEVEINFDHIPDTIDTNEPDFATVNNESETNNITSKKEPPSIIASIKLKKHKDVLFEMYKVAKRKAQEAKKVAIRTYLEAKEIKAAYLLDNSDLSDSDDDSDDENKV
jgi:hypothetical protein